MDCSLLGSCVHGILKARILEWVAMPSSRGFSQPKDQTQMSCIAAKFFTIWATQELPPQVCLLHWQVGSWPWGRLGSPSKTSEWPDQLGKSPCRVTSQFLKSHQGYPTQVHHSWNPKSFSDGQNWPGAAHSTIFSKECSLEEVHQCPN